MATPDQIIEQPEVLVPPESIERIIRFLIGITERTSAASSESSIGNFAPGAMAIRSRQFVEGITRQGGIGRIGQNAADAGAIPALLAKYQVSVADVSGFTDWLTKWNQRRLEAEELAPAAYQSPDMSLVSPQEAVTAEPSDQAHDTSSPTKQSPDSTKPSGFATGIMRNIWEFNRLTAAFAAGAYISQSQSTTFPNHGLEPADGPLFPAQYAVAPGNLLRSGYSPLSNGFGGNPFVTPPYSALTLGRPAPTSLQLFQLSNQPATAQVPFGGTTAHAFVPSAQASSLPMSLVVPTPGVEGIRQTEVERALSPQASPMPDTQTPTWITPTDRVAVPSSGHSTVAPILPTSSLPTVLAQMPEQGQPSANDRGSFNTSSSASAIHQEIEKRYSVLQSSILVFESLVATAVLVSIVSAASSKSLTQRVSKSFAAATPIIAGPAKYFPGAAPVRILDAPSAVLTSSDLTDGYLSSKTVRHEIGQLPSMPFATPYTNRVTGRSNIPYVNVGEEPATALSARIRPRIGPSAGIGVIARVNASLPWSNSDSKFAERSVPVVPNQWKVGQRQPILPALAIGVSRIDPRVGIEEHPISGTPSTSKKWDSVKRQLGASAFPFEVSAGNSVAVSVGQSGQLRSQLGDAIPGLSSFSSVATPGITFARSGSEPPIEQQEHQATLIQPGTFEAQLPSARLEPRVEPSAEMGQLSIFAPPMVISGPDIASGGSGMSINWSDLASSMNSLDEGGISRLKNVLPASASVVYPAISPQDASQNSVNLQLSPTLLHHVLTQTHGVAAGKIAGEVSRLSSVKSTSPRAATPFQASIVPVKPPIGQGASVLGTTASKSSLGVLGEATSGQSRRGGVLDVFGLPVRVAPSLSGRSELTNEVAWRGGAGDAAEATAVKPAAFAELQSRLFPSAASVNAEPDRSAWSKAAPSFGLRDARPTTILSPDSRVSPVSATSPLAQTQGTQPAANLTPQLSTSKGKFGLGLPWLAHHPSTVGYQPRHSPSMPSGALGGFHKNNWFGGAPSAGQSGTHVATPVSGHNNLFTPRSAINQALPFAHSPSGLFPTGYLPSSSGFGREIQTSKSDQFALSIRDIPIAKVSKPAFSFHGRDDSGNHRVSISGSAASVPFRISRADPAILRSSQPAAQSQAVGNRADLSLPTRQVSDDINRPGFKALTTRSIVDQAIASKPAMTTSAGRSQSTSSIVGSGISMPLPPTSSKARQNAGNNPGQMMTIQRSVSSAVPASVSRENAQQSANRAMDAPQKKQGADVDLLASEVWGLLKRRLSIESERLGYRTR